MAEDEKRRLTDNAREDAVKSIANTAIIFLVVKDEWELSRVCEIKITSSYSKRV